MHKQHKPAKTRRPKIRGLASKFKSLEELWLQFNQITDAGCATLASALRGGALPALKRLDLLGNPASQQAKATVWAALSLRLGQ